MTPLAFDRSGTPGAPPLVLVHGLGGDRHVWAPVIERVAADRDVLTVDLPGFGASPALSDDHAPPALAAHLAAVLRSELGWERPHLAGNSLGGWVALEMARAGAAASVTAIAPAGFWSRPLGPKPMVMRNLSRALRPLLPLAMRSRAIREFGLQGSVAHPERVPVDAAVAMARAYAGAPGFVAVNRAMRGSQFLDGHEIGVPVTLAWCEHDRLVVPPRRPLLAAREVVLHDCGHVPMYDDPDAVARVVLDGSAVAVAA
jgi:pimeloyl-ACP methyl ester carboxylesterase